MTGAEIPIIIAAAGTGTAIYGQISAAEAQGDATKRNAALKNSQADEVLSREMQNESAIMREAELTATRYQSAAASTGIEGASIGGTLSIMANAQEAVTNSNREARFKADMLRAGAEIDVNLASDTVRATYLTGAGTAIKTGADIYGVMRKPGTPEKF